METAVPAASAWFSVSVIASPSTATDEAVTALPSTIKEKSPGAGTERVSSGSSKYKTTLDWSGLLDVCMASPPANAGGMPSSTVSILNPSNESTEVPALSWRVLDPPGRLYDTSASSRARTASVSSTVTVSPETPTVVSLSP